jgi:hypothetical protein
VGAIVIYFNVNVNVLKQIYFALVRVIKDWMSQNAWHNCENFILLHSSGYTAGS